MIKSEDLDIGKRLIDIRNAFGYTKAQVADKAHINRMMYIRYENNKCNIPFVCILKLCDLYNVSAEYFAGEDTNIIRDKNLMKHLLNMRNNKF